MYFLVLGYQAFIELIDCKLLTQNLNHRVFKLLILR